MVRPARYDFLRYLAAKRSIDDRALHRGVWERLLLELEQRSLRGSKRVLEVAGGIGTMVERLSDVAPLRGSEYTLTDSDSECIAEARRRLAGSASASSASASSASASSASASSASASSASASSFALHFEVADLDTLEGRGGAATEPFDLVIAAAFLDLVDARSAVTVLRSLVAPGGLLYLPIHFDGVTAFEPALDPVLDSRIEELYHRTMDERTNAGRTSGDSRTGRRLFTHLRAGGLEILAAGGSDWIVMPVGSEYPEDEAYFLHHLIETVHGALQGRSELDQRELDGWSERRHQQVERAELVYLTHQLDFLCLKPAVVA